MGYLARRRAPPIGSRWGDRQNRSMLQPCIRISGRGGLLRPTIPMVSPEEGLEFARLLGRLQVPAGLCADCRHLRLVESAHSVFARCGLANDNPLYRRYPPLPVIHCPGHESRSDRAD